MLRPIDFQKWVSTGSKGKPSVQLVSGMELDPGTKARGLTLGHGKGSSGRGSSPGTAEELSKAMLIEGCL